MNSYPVETITYHEPLGIKKRVPPSLKTMTLIHRSERNDLLHTIKVMNVL